MRVAFDSQIFLSQRYGGVSRYFARIIEEMAEMGEDPKIFATLYQNEYAHALPRDLVKGKWISKLPKRSGKLLQAFNIAVGSRGMKAWRPQVVHETWYLKARIAPRGVPVMTTIYDMIHEMFSSQHSSVDAVSSVKRAAVARADHVFCISENTKKDLIEIFKIPEHKVSVSLLACDVQNLSRESIKTKFDRPFLLYVGHRAGYKNFANMLESLAISKEARSLDVVAFGGLSFDREEMDHIRKLGFRKGQVRQFTGDDTTLAECYSQAVGLIYPSLYEGFGLPPLEAMACGCPVISSNTSSMPEVIGDAGEYFDPENREMMSHAIDKVVSSPDLRRNLIAAGYLRVNHFSWRRCARETLDGYRQYVH